MLDCVRYSSSSPVIHGPILVHLKKEFSSYHYFLSTLIGLKPELSLFQAFGSDGEESLVQALKANFPWAHQLRCFIHMRRNIKTKLQDLKISASVSSVILGDIFGGSDGSSFQEGLVDANDEVAFFTQLSDLKSKWEELEQVEEPKCFQWFEKYEAKVFVGTMIKPIREAVGLGPPPAEFTTNACESGHASLQNYLLKPCSWQVFVLKSPWNLFKIKSTKWN